MWAYGLFLFLNNQNVMTSLLRVGVIGVGHLGRHHARIYDELPLVSLVGIVDTNISTGTTIGQEFGVPCFKNLANLLPLVDAVSVAVPTSAHHSVVTACLRHGCHPK